MYARIACAVAFLVAATSWAVAEEPKEKNKEDITFLNAKDAGPDFEIQGEYVGTLKFGDEEQRWGAQVIALGDGKFDGVGYEGGLPGDGWKRGDHKEEIHGEMQSNGEAILKDEEVTIVIRKGEFILSHAGQTVGTLKKVERKSPTLGAKPPENAIVLFDGKSAENFDHGQITEETLLAAGCESKQKFGDHSLHVEFRTPFRPYAREQGRGNSGVYAQGRYEIQVLDSFGLEGRNNECGGIYSIAEPLVNMCFPPLSWQTYDIDFTAARYDDSGKKTENPRITIRHNGVVIHENLELKQGTPGKDPEGPGPGPVYLQGHGNPVVFRNIWVVPK